MTQIPDAAVHAAAVILHAGCWCEDERPGYAGCGPETRYQQAREVLADALPHLGEHGTVYGYEFPMPDSATRVAQVDFKERIPPGETVFQRTVIYGEWTEATP